jgi:carboxylesterase
MTVIGAPAGLLNDWSAVGSGKNKDIGVLLVHGFTGSPSSMRPWAEYLNQRGFSVRVPLLPGHGTKPEDLNEVKWEQWPAKVEAELAELSKTCSKVFICGLSMGGAVTLNVASRHSHNLSGIILVNPMSHLRFVSPELAFAVSRVKKFLKSVGDDIKRPGVTEWGYDANPTVGVYELLKMLKFTRSRLQEVTVPMQLFHSVDDHTLPVSNTEIIMQGVGSKVKQRIELTNSYHVATIDYDAEIIYENSRIFIETHAGNQS